MLLIDEIDKADIEFPNDLLSGNFLPRLTVAFWPFLDKKKRRYKHLFFKTRFKV